MKYSFEVSFSLCWRMTARMLMFCHSERNYLEEAGPERRARSKKLKYPWESRLTPSLVFTPNNLILIQQSNMGQLLLRGALGGLNGFFKKILCMCCLLFSLLRERLSEHKHIWCVFNKSPPSSLGLSESWETTKGRQPGGIWTSAGRLRSSALKLQRSQFPSWCRFHSGASELWCFLCESAHVRTSGYVSSSGEGRDWRPFYIGIVQVCCVET